MNANATGEDARGSCIRDGGFIVQTSAGIYLSIPDCDADGLEGGR